jgi:hypothetical protein
VGFKISWVAFNGLSKEDALRTLNATDTGEADEYNETPFSGAELPGGWYIVFSNDFGFVTPTLLESLSSNCTLIACQLHEGIMFSASYGFSHGIGQWVVVHDRQDGIRDLTVKGTPPEAFEDIRVRISQEQDDNGGDESDVDYYFDVPVDLAESICGYRHDRVEFAWGAPQFTVLDVR